MKKLLCAALALSGCGGSGETPDPVAWRDEALAATRPSAGGPARREGLERFASFWSDLREERVRELVRAVYAPDVRFNDTVKAIRGVDALERYLVETARNVESCRVEIDEAVPSPEGLYIRWRMYFVFKSLRRGETQASVGMSHLRFDREGRVAYHQDYWDSGSNLYEKLPLLGAGIRAVKRRL